MIVCWNILKFVWKYIFREFIFLIPSIGRPVVLCDWVFFWWGPCLVCPMSMWFGMPGPRAPGGCSLVSRGSMGGNVRGDFLGPCLVFPLSMGWFGMPGPRVLRFLWILLFHLMLWIKSGRKVQIFMIIILREDFFRFFKDWFTNQLTN